MRRGHLTNFGQEIHTKISATLPYLLYELLLLYILYCAHHAVLLYELCCIGKVSEKLENFWQGINSSNFPLFQTPLSGKISTTIATQSSLIPQTGTTPALQPHHTPENNQAYYITHPCLRTRTCMRMHTLDNPNTAETPVKSTFSNPHETKRLTR